MSKDEIWRDVVGFEGFYKVSNKGNVYSVERRSLQGIKIGERMLKPLRDKYGYLTVGLYKNGKMQRKFIHRLVTEAFIPNPNGFPEVNHKDEVKDNNNVNNLEWCDTRYNLNYGTARKRAAKKTSKKVKAVNVETGEVLTFSSTVEAERKGYHQGTISASCRGVYKNSKGKLIGDGHTYRGHRWSYTEEGE